MYGCTCRDFCLLSIGGLFMFLGIFFEAYGFHAIVRLYFQENAYIKPGSLVWEEWKTIPFPIYAHFHFFNVTNPDDIKNFGAKPKLQEIGRYTYKGAYDKSIISINDDETITYYARETYKFQPQMSNGSEDDLMTIINLPLLALAPHLENVANWTFFAPFANIAIRGYDEKLFVTKTVRELLFEGYYEPLLSHVQAVTGDNIVMDNKFALFNLKNATLQGPFDVFTGQSDLSKSTQLNKYKGSVRMNVWKDEKCDKVKESDGAFFSPFINKEDTLGIFISDFCRVFPLKYERDVSHRGVSTYRFIFPEQMLASPSENPENSCYCSRTPCHPSGIFDLTPCRNMELLVSYPHFYGADPSLLQGVEGLHPDHEKHSSFVDLHPIIGSNIRGLINLQLNLKLRPFGGLADFKHVPEVIFPLVWMSTDIEMTDDVLSRIFWLWTVPSTTVTVFCWIGIILGAALCFAGIRNIPFNNMHTTAPHRREPRYSVIELVSGKEKYVHR